jgi:hypothetical protein
MGSNHAPSPRGTYTAGGQEALGVAVRRKAKRKAEPGRPSRLDVSQCLHIWARFYRIDGSSEPRNLCLPSAPWLTASDVDKP